MGFFGSERRVVLCPTQRRSEDPPGFVDLADSHPSEGTVSGLEWHVGQMIRVQESGEFSVGVTDFCKRGVPRHPEGLIMRPRCCHDSRVTRWATIRQPLAV